MANNVTRITANGNFYITGNFDEISYNPNLNCRNLAYPADLSLWTRNYDNSLVLVMDWGDYSNIVLSNANAQVINISSYGLLGSANVTTLNLRLSYPLKV